MSVKLEEIKIQIKEINIKEKHLKENLEIKIEKLNIKRKKLQEKLNKLQETELKEEIIPLVDNNIKTEILAEENQKEITSKKRGINILPENIEIKDIKWFNIENQEKYKSGKNTVIVLGEAVCVFNNNEEITLKLEKYEHIKQYINVKYMDEYLHRCSTENYYNHLTFLFRSEYEKQYKKTLLESYTVNISTQFPVSETNSEETNSDDLILPKSQPLYDSGNWVDNVPKVEETTKYKYNKEDDYKYNW